MSHDQAPDPAVPKRPGLKDSQAEIAALREKSERIKSDIAETNRKLDNVAKSADAPRDADPKRD
jgi:hypothetical protein